jgi:hypothetical protein
MVLTTAESSDFLLKGDKQVNKQHKARCGKAKWTVQATDLHENGCVMSSSKTISATGSGRCSIKSPSEANWKDCIKMSERVWVCCALPQLTVYF